MSDEVFENVSRNCGYSNNNLDMDTASSSCADAWHAFDKGEIDPYNIYAPVCVDTPQGAYYPSSNVSTKYI
jgi:serine carboxypeptidase-like clade 2